MLLQPASDPFLPIPFTARQPVKNGQICPGPNIYLLAGRCTAVRIGYPCINRSIGCRGDRTFRLVSFSEEHLYDTVAGNLACLWKILAWNLKSDILFFRISSDLIPFASHPVCTLPWQKYFAADFEALGEFIRRNGIRISMHPDQFIVLNAHDDPIVERSIAELEYHAAVLDMMNLDTTAKIQLHVGGVYGDRQESLERFIRVYGKLDTAVSRRLVIENDEQRFSVADCLMLHERTGIPVLFDVFHHSCNNHGESPDDVLTAVSKTWKSRDGILMVDYSSQHPDKRPGSHAEHIDPGDFTSFLRQSQPHDFDLMLEIKDKEASARIAVCLARSDPRFVGGYPNDPVE
jgi:UV DNA damage endonuclease